MLIKSIKLKIVILLYKILKPIGNWLADYYNNNEFKKK